MSRKGRKTLGITMGDWAPPRRGALRRKNGLRKALLVKTGHRPTSRKNGASGFRGEEKINTK